MTYLEDLKRWAAEINRQQAEERARKSRPLHEKIQEWYDGLPPDLRMASYRMEELVLLFGASAGSIGTALHQLGWERKRLWNTNGPYARYWVPP